MKYIIRKTCFMLQRHKAIYFLLIIEMSVGISMYVYSLNLSYSIKLKEKQWQAQETDLRLRIYGKEETADKKDLPIELEDYEKIKAIVNDGVFFYTSISDIIINKSEIYNFEIVFMDVEKFGGNPNCAYVGRNLLSRIEQDGFQTGFQLFSVKKNQFALVSKGNQEECLKIEKLPDEYAGKLLSKDIKDEDIFLDDSIIIPLTKLELFSDVARQFTAKFFMVLSSNQMLEADIDAEIINQYFNEKHGKYYEYQLYSPIKDLQNNTYRTKININTANKIGVLMLVTVFVGSISIFRLLLWKREKELGICQACGAKMEALIMEIVMEVFVLCFIGTSLGCVIGFVLTYWLPSDVQTTVTMTGHYQSLLLCLLICVIITITVSMLTIQKFYSKEIIELIQN